MLSDIQIKTLGALQYRFPTIFDAWCFFDPDSTWDVPAADFRKRSAMLRLGEEPVDVEGVIRKLDTTGQESVGPLDFVNVLKWHELGAGVSDLRVSFDAAAKRQYLAADVAMRRSREPPRKRLAEDSLKWCAADEVAQEGERQRRDKTRRLAAERAAKQQRMRELYGPPQIIKDYARKRDWKRLQDLEVDVVRLSCSMDEMRVAAQKECLGVRCEELSLRYYERCSVFYGIPAAERDDAVRMIQRSLRACTAWRHNTISEIQS